MERMRIEQERKTTKQMDKNRKMAGIMSNQWHRQCETLSRNWVFWLWFSGREKMNVKEVIRIEVRGEGLRKWAGGWERHKKLRQEEGEEGCWW